MFKLTKKNGTLFFKTIDEVCYFLSKTGTTLFENGSFVKISYVEDFKK